ncbi:hypothetical protein ABPG72_008753 [Tetrahymena utriculariae]
MDTLKKYAQDVKTKVLNLNRTPLEKLLHEVTSNDNWGVNPKLLRQVSDESYHFENREVILNFIFHRLSNKTKNWRKILKTLELIEFLIKNGLYDLCSDFRREIVHITTHCDFQMLEKGVDRGLSIRNKAQKIIQLLSDDGDLQFERDQAKQLYQRSMNIQGFGSDKPAPFQNSNYKKESKQNSVYKNDEDEDDEHNDIYKYNQNKESDDDNDEDNRKSKSLRNGNNLKNNQNNYHEEEEQSGSQNYQYKKQQNVSQKQANAKENQTKQQSNDFWQQQWEWGFQANSNKIQQVQNQKQSWNQNGYIQQPKEQNQKQTYWQQQNQNSKQNQQQIQEQQRRNEEEQQRQEKKKQEEQEQKRNLQNNIQKQTQQQLNSQQQKKKETEINLLDLDIDTTLQNGLQNKQMAFYQQQQQQQQQQQIPQDSQQNMMFSQNLNMFNQYQQNQNQQHFINQNDTGFNQTKVELKQNENGDEYKNFSKNEQMLIDLNEIKTEQKKEEQKTQFDNLFQFGNSNLSNQNNYQQNLQSDKKRDYSALNSFSAYQQQMNQQQFYTYGGSFYGTNVSGTFQNQQYMYQQPPQMFQSQSYYQSQQNYPYQMNQKSQYQQ